MWRPRDFDDFIDGGQLCTSARFLQQHAEYGPMVSAADRHVRLFWIAMAELSGSDIEVLLSRMWAGAVEGAAGASARPSGAGAGTNSTVPAELFCVPVSRLPAPFRILQPTALSMLSPDDAEILLLGGEHCAIALPRFSSLEMMKTRLLALVRK